MSACQTGALVDVALAYVAYASSNRLPDTSSAQCPIGHRGISDIGA
jgi:hypothetical protein